MDNMLEHPWIELQVLIKEKWLTQKAFASILWKKVSEVNELLKWKRNITIQRDYLLHQVLWTPIKYRILKQIDYDYSLLDIEETTDLSSWMEWEILDDEQTAQDSSSQTPQNDNITQTTHPEHSEESIGDNTSSWASANGLKWETEELTTQDSSSQTPQNDNITQTSHSNPEESVSSNTSFWTEWRIQENIKPIDSSADKSVSEWQTEPQKTPTQEQNQKEDEDFKKRARIFKSF